MVLMSFTKYPGVAVTAQNNEKSDSAEEFHKVYPKSDKKEFCEQNELDVLALVLKLT